MSDEHFRSGLILVRRYGPDDSPPSQFRNRFPDTGIRLGQVGAMFRVIFDEVAAQPFDVLRAPFRFGQRALDQFGDAVADEITVRRELVLGITVPA